MGAIVIAYRTVESGTYMSCDRKRRYTPLDGSFSPHPYSGAAGHHLSLALEIVPNRSGEGRGWSQDLRTNSSHTDVGCTVLVFTALVIASSVVARKPRVPFVFRGLLAIVPFRYPPVLTIDVDGVASRTWFGKEKKIRWEDVTSLHYNTRSRQFTARSTDGGKITHAGFNADPDGFRTEIQRRTRLPLQVASPGTWRTETIEVPFEESHEGLGDQRQLAPSPSPGSIPHYDLAVLTSHDAQPTQIATKPDSTTGGGRK